MSRRQKDPLRALTTGERRALEQLSRASSEPASHVARAKLVLAVAEGRNYAAAARSVGRRSGDAVAQLVARFNAEGLAAIAPRHGGGAVVRYGDAARARMLAEARRTPDREADGTTTWSLSTLRRALRRAPDGLPGVSEDTVRRVLREAGRHWQRDRSWCETGVAARQRKAGPVTVTDPDAAPKKG
jgi:transposase